MMIIGWVSAWLGSGKGSSDFWNSVPSTKKRSTLDWLQGIEGVFRAFNVAIPMPDDHVPVQFDPFSENRQVGWAEPSAAHDTHIRANGDGYPF
jgi:hypothetical protein